MKTINFNFQLSNYDNKPAGLAALIVAEQMEVYIKRIELEENYEKLELMRNCKNQLIRTEKITINDTELQTLNDWLLNYSGFYGTAKEELIAAFV